MMVPVDIGITVMTATTVLMDVGIVIGMTAIGATIATATDQVRNVC